jgi:hypothetical protein
MTDDQKIKNIREISIVIDDWDDIFSDFDPRPLEDRAFSEDFIYELKKRYRETKTGRVFVSICAPIRLKDEKSEKTVIQRLKREFKREGLQRRKDINRMRTRGAAFVFCGICFLGILTLLTYHEKFSRFAIDMIGIILMPLGWFGIWEGLSKIVDSSPKFHQDQILFEKLAKADYKFKYLEKT